MNYLYRTVEVQGNKGNITLWRMDNHQLSGYGPIIREDQKQSHIQKIISCRKHMIDTILLFKWLVPTLDFRLALILWYVKKYYLVGIKPQLE